MLQLIVGFLVGAVFVSIFSGSGQNYAVSARDFRDRMPECVTIGSHTIAIDGRESETRNVLSNRFTILSLEKVIARFSSETVLYSRARSDEKSTD